MSKRPSMISFKGRTASRSNRPAFAPRKIPYKVQLEGVDVTPWPLLEDPAIASLVLNAATAALSTASALNYIEQGPDFFGPRALSDEVVHDMPYISLTQLQPAVAGAVAALPSLTAVAKLDDFYHWKSGSWISVISEESPTWLIPQDSEEDKETMKEKGRLKDDTPVYFEIHESETFELFELPSETRVPIDPDYSLESRDRELFTRDRAAIKTRADALIQTEQLWMLTKPTQESRKQKRNRRTMVTSWELWDVENSGKEEDSRLAMLRRRHIRRIATEGGIAVNSAFKSISTMSGFTATEEPMTESSDKSVGTVPSAFSPFSSGTAIGPDKRMSHITKNKFTRVAMIIERLLQEKESKLNQMLFHGLPPKDVLEPDLRYKYEFRTLWTFETEDSKGRCVTSIAWSENPFIFAAGYGRYAFSTINSSGVVKVWNIKNPTNPERIIGLKSPVNICAFSKRHPYLLAIGLHSGSMVLVDISTVDCPVIFESPETQEPLWSITWLQMESHGEDEMLLAGTQDGRILRFRRSEQFKSVQMMRVARSEGSMRGISRVSTATGAVPCSCYTAVLTLCECPTESVGYLAGTDDGCIHLCSAHYLHRHLAASACHVGPVYACQVSPFVDQVYLTCGADWTIRIWAQGVYEPLLTFSSSMEPIESAVWSPVDSCLVASVSGSQVSIWDLRRKIQAPAGTVSSPNQDKYSVVSWAKDGALVVGDRNGRVQIIKVEGLPLPSFFQQRSLCSSLRRALRVTKPELYKALRNLGKPF